MILVAPLMADCSRAASGSVTFKLRGTNTTATVYSDATGLTAVTSHTLSAYGTIERYVNAPVDVVVLDSLGASVKTFTVMSASTDTEVRSASFTGVTYDTLASAAGNPTMLSTVLNLWNTSAGAIDFKVSKGGVATNLSTAFASLAGLFFDAKDAAYGCVGDGVTDDTAAASACIAAADSAGGIAFFPPGTYRMVAGSTVAGKASIWGAGPDATVFAIDHATNHTLTAGSATTYGQQSLVGIRFKSLQTASGRCVSFTSATAAWTIQNCYFDKASTADSVYFAAGAPRVTLRDCYFDMAGGSSRAIVAASAAGAGYVRVQDCTLVAYAGAYSPTNAMVYCNRLRMSGCKFDASPMTSGTMIGIDVWSSGKNDISGNYFVNPVGGTVTGIAWGTITDNYEERGNTFESSYTPQSFSGTTTETVLGYSEAREKSTQALTATTSTTVNMNARANGIIQVVVTAAGSTTVVLSAADAANASAPIGSKLYVLVSALGGGACTFNVSGTYFSGKGVTGVAITSGQFIAYTFVRTSSAMNGSKWQQVGSNAIALTTA